VTRTILQITTFPIAAPRHGGQIRAASIKRVLESSGFRVVNVGVFNRAHYPENIPDIDTGGLNLGPYRNYWQVSDFSLGAAVAADESSLQRLVGFIRDLRCDAVMLEEPWLGRAFLSLMQAGSLRLPLLYNSYNIEHIAKGLILENAGIAESDSIAADIFNLEREVVRVAAASSAVTSYDAETMSAWTPNPVVIAKNGTAKRKTSHLHKILPAAIDTNVRYMMFVGSAHPPNVTGFSELVLGTLRKLKSNEQIIVAGSVCDAIWQVIQDAKTPYLIRDKLGLIGQVTDFALTCLIANASGLLLPITFGGGSNLKTAEALVSGKRIVASSRSFRGFEDFVSTPGVLLADNETEFGAAIRTTFDASNDDGDIERPGVESLLWEECLQPLVEVVKSVI
jgi:hypothetical protein